MDKATKAPVLDMNGKQITAEQEFKTFMSSGKVKVTFTFDATSLYGKDTVRKRKSSTTEQRKAGDCNHQIFLKKSGVISDAIMSPA